MTLSEINVREKKFHNQLHDSGGQRYENKFSFLGSLSENRSVTLFKNQFLNIIPVL